MYPSPSPSWPLWHLRNGEHGRGLQGSDHLLGGHPRDLRQLPCSEGDAMQDKPPPQPGPLAPRYLLVTVRGSLITALGWSWCAPRQPQPSATCAPPAPALPPQPCKQSAAAHLQHSWAAAVPERHRPRHRNTGTQWELECGSSLALHPASPGWREGILNPLWHHVSEWWNRRAGVD